MTAKQIMQALLEGKKVGDCYDYMYLNADGELMTNLGERQYDAEAIGRLFVWWHVTVQPEDGP